MDEQIKKGAVSVIIRCRGYSRLMAEGFLTTCQEAEVGRLASLAANPDCGEEFLILWGEISDRLRLEEEARRQAESGTESQDPDDDDDADSDEVLEPTDIIAE